MFSNSHFLGTRSTVWAIARLCSEGVPAVALRLALEPEEVTMEHITGQVGDQAMLLCVAAHPCPPLPSGAHGRASLFYCFSIPSAIQL